MIAEKAGASPSLVSRILADKVVHISVSEQKIQLVKHIAEELNYSRQTA